MHIDIRDLQEGENEFTFEESPDALHIHDETLHFVLPIQTRLSLYKLGVSITIKGETAFHLRQECARCLEPFEVKEAIPLHFVLQQGRPEGLEDDTDETLIWLDNEAEQLDLGTQVKDYILLEIPVNPICKESCAGLCTQCGENLNVRQCDCTNEKVDPRWEALRALKDT